MVSVVMFLGLFFHPKHEILLLMLSQSEASIRANRLTLRSNRRRLILQSFYWCVGGPIAFPMRTKPIGMTSRRSPACQLLRPPKQLESVNIKNNLTIAKEG